jgi:DNA adenine methylase
MKTPKQTSKSFLKWAGGKSKLTQKISEVVGDCERLVEPFAGSGSVFLGTDYPEYLLCDTNSDLIDLFNHVKNPVTKKELLVLTDQFFGGAYTNDTSYYQLRDKFNLTPRGDVLRSAMFLYLNKHAFNGLCRYNSKGGFNAPYAKHATVPYYPVNEIENFHQKSVIAEFKHLDFVECFKLVRPGDAVYCDPPYVPMTDKQDVVSYSVGSFTADHQRLLVDLSLASLSTVNRVVISNHDTEFTRELYKKAVIHEISVSRSISSKGDGRGRVKEVMAEFNHTLDTK